MYVYGVSQCSPLKIYKPEAGKAMEHPGTMHVSADGRRKQPSALRLLPASPLTPSKTSGGFPCHS